MADDGLYAALVRRGMSRRAFLQFSAAMAAALALPAAYGPRLARAVTSAPRIPVIWLRGQSCGGNTEQFLRSTEPTVAELLLDVLSVEYHDSLLAASGTDATAGLASVAERYPDGYYAVVEGSIPTGAGGGYCLVGGRPLVDVAREVCAGALGTIALGSCAFDGGTAGANGGPTDAGGVRQVVTDARLVTLPGCPMNAVNLAAVIVHHLATGNLPPTDPMGRPLFAYGGLVHNQCERRPHFEFGEFALSWGDEGAQKGWCLYKLGCKGPETMANCPTVRYGGDLSWNVRAGAGCVGCTMPGFWDAMMPAYKRLGSPLPFLPNLTVDMLGGAMVAGIGVVAAVHATGMTVRMRRAAAAERRAAGLPVVLTSAPAELPPPEPEATAEPAEPRPAPSAERPVEAELVEAEPVEAPDIIEPEAEAAAAAAPIEPEPVETETAEGATAEGATTGSAAPAPSIEPEAAPPVEPEAARPAEQAQPTAPDEPAGPAPDAGEVR